MLIPYRSDTHFRSKYSFKAKRPKLTDPAKDEQDLEASVRTLSALLTQGDPNIIAAHPAAGDPSLEERVAATLTPRHISTLLLVSRAFGHCL